MLNKFMEDIETVNPIEEQKPPYKKMGGWRPGAGRPKTIDRKALMKDCTEKLLPVIGEAFLQLEPKEIMLIGARLAAYEGDWVNAVAFADKAAPYFNQKLANIQVNLNKNQNFNEMSDEDLMGYLQATEVKSKTIKGKNDKRRIGKSK